MKKLWNNESSQIYFSHNFGSGSNIENKFLEIYNSIQL